MVAVFPLKAYPKGFGANRQDECRVLGREKIVDEAVFQLKIGGVYQEPSWLVLGGQMWAVGYGFSGFISEPFAIAVYFVDGVAMPLGPWQWRGEICRGRSAEEVALINECFDNYKRRVAPCFSKVKRSELEALYAYIAKNPGVTEEALRVQFPEFYVPLRLTALRELKAVVEVNSDLQYRYAHTLSYTAVGDRTPPYRTAEEEYERNA